jgi:hypothetical protein
MSYDVNSQKNYPTSAETASQTASQTLETLGGKLTKNSNPAKGQLEADFNKKVKDQPLPNRCQVRVKIAPAATGGCTVMTKVYPIDPMGNKLTFGVRGDAAQVVSATFAAELEAVLTQ